MPGQQPSPLRLRLVNMYACLGVTCHLHFWQNDRGLLRATAVTRGVERTANKSQLTKLTLKKKILLPLLPGFELETYRSRVRRSNLQAIPAPLFPPALGLESLAASMSHSHGGKQQAMSRTSVPEHD